MSNEWDAVVIADWSAPLSIAGRVEPFLNLRAKAPYERGRR
jgi:hypothetical protein